MLRAHSRTDGRTASVRKTINIPVWWIFAWITLNRSTYIGTYTSFTYGMNASEKEREREKGIQNKERRRKNRENKLSLMTTKKERKKTRKPPIQLTMDNNNSNTQKWNEWWQLFWLKVNLFKVIAVIHSKSLSRSSRRPVCHPDGKNKWERES